MDNFLYISMFLLVMCISCDQVRENVRFEVRGSLTKALNGSAIFTWHNEGIREYLN